MKSFEQPWSPVADDQQIGVPRQSDAGVLIDNEVGEVVEPTGSGQTPWWPVVPLGSLWHGPHLDGDGHNSTEDLDTPAWPRMVADPQPSDIGRDRTIITEEQRLRHGITFAGAREMQQGRWSRLGGAMGDQSRSRVECLYPVRGEGALMTE